MKRGLSLLVAARPLTELLALGHAARAPLGEQFAVVLTVGTCSDGGLVLGRWLDAAPAARPLAGARVSGGPALWIPAGTLVVALALAHDSVLLDTPRDRLLNRNVRGCLRGLAAQYFGAETIAREGQPIGVLGWTRDEEGRALIELFVGIDEPVEIVPVDPNRPVMRGRSPVGLRSLGVQDSALELGERVIRAHERFGVELERVESLAGPTPTRAPDAEAIAWLPAQAGPIGQLQVGRSSAGRLRLRGEFFADEDLPAWLERTLADTDPRRCAARALGEGRIEGIDLDTLVRALTSASG